MKEVSIEFKSSLETIKNMYKQ